MHSILRLVTRRHFASALGASCISLLLSGVVVVMADFGAPQWVFIPPLLWMLTIGLPTTAAVLLAASFWGTTPALSGIVPFVISSGILGLLFQWAGFACTAKLLPSRLA